MSLSYEPLFFSRNNVFIYISFSITIAFDLASLIYHCYSLQFIYNGCIMFDGRSSIERFRMPIYNYLFLLLCYWHGFYLTWAPWILFYITRKWDRKSLQCYWNEKFIVVSIIKVYLHPCLHLILSSRNRSNCHNRVLEKSRASYVYLKYIIKNHYLRTFNITSCGHW